MHARKLITAAAGLLLAWGSARAAAQELLDFSFKAAHNAYERPYESPFDYADLLELYDFNITQMRIDFANGNLFHMITSGDQRIPLGFQVGWLNTWSLELDLCWRSGSSTLVRHFPGMQAQLLTTMLQEYWSDSHLTYRTRDRFTIFWFDWKTDSECTAWSPAALGRVRSEILSAIPADVIFTTRDLLEFNGLDPDGPFVVSELTWPSPQWLFVNGYRAMFVSQNGDDGRFMFTSEFVANRSDTKGGWPIDDGRIWRMYPDLSAAGSDFKTPNVVAFLEALEQFNPWAYTRGAWDRALIRGYNIAATNDINDSYSVHWGLDYPDGFRWAPPMPMYVGGFVFWPDAVPGTAAEPYSKLRFAEQHLRLTETISGSGITDPWPLLIQGGTHTIDLAGHTNRFEPRVPLRLQAKPGQTVRLVPGG